MKILWQKALAKSIDGTISSVGAECNRNDVKLPHEIPDMWQFCRTIGKGNHDNTPYNVLCCGEPPNFQSQLQRLSRFRRHNPYRTIHFTFAVPFDPTVAWWHMLPGKQVITPTHIVLTYNDQTTILAALLATFQQQTMDPTPDNLPTSIAPSPAPPISLNTVLTPLAMKKNTSSRSQLKAINWSSPTSVKVGDYVTNPVRNISRKVHNLWPPTSTVGGSETNPVRNNSRKVHKKLTFTEWEMKNQSEF
jgi:hypothetical protein